MEQGPVKHEEHKGGEGFMKKQGFWPPFIGGRGGGGRPRGPPPIGGRGGGCRLPTQLRGMVLQPYPPPIPPWGG